MADRRVEDTPLAPRRSLAAPSQAAESNGDTGKRPFAGRMSAAVAAAGNAVSSASSRPGAGAAAASRSRRSVTSGRAASTGSTSTTASSSAATGTRAGAPAARPRGTRRARLRLVHIDKW
jgi:hypothetical protein